MTPDTARVRRHEMPFGARCSEGRTRFRLWAPAARQVELLLDPAGSALRKPMAAREDGWFELETAAIPGHRYAYSLDGGAPIPDPASRSQPDGVHGPSEVVDPAEFLWPDADWQGRPWHEAVLYELHVGTFSPEGSFAGVERRLDYLAQVGVTMLEIMPVGAWPGRFNWGYDGVAPFAPAAPYGRPEDFKRLVAAAHARGLMVILDVILNHFGPEGNYLHASAPAFFTERYSTPWGAALDFEGPQSRWVRAYFKHLALYWVEEFNLDGLRLDAVHAIHDASPRHFLEELAADLRAAETRPLHVILENDDNSARLLERDESGRPRRFTAQWNDDWHHAAHLLLTGEVDGYYEDYAADTLQALGRGLAEGFIFQGEPSPHRDGRPRGEPSGGLPPLAFVNFLQNHDQIGNRAFGERLEHLAPAAAIEAALALLLLCPAPPLLFMGEEWGATEPFPFFCDFQPELAEAVRQGRRREFQKFPQFRDPETAARIPDPTSPATFASAKLDWRAPEQPARAARLEYCRRLLALRRHEIVPHLPTTRSGRCRLKDGLLEVLWPRGTGGSLLLQANLSAMPIPGVARPQGRLLFARGLLQEPAPEGPLPAWAVLWFAGAEGG